MTHGTRRQYRSGCRCDDCTAVPHDAHGTSNGYNNYGCRCDACRATWAATVRRWRARRQAALSEKSLRVPHGTAGGYGNHGCRCAACTTAYTADTRARRARRLRRLQSADTANRLPPEDQWRTHEAIQCLECGQWKAALGRHLPPAHGITADEYREAWGMRQRQPLTAGYLSDVRREIAVATGGPERLRALAPIVAPAAAEARRGRERREQERRSVRTGQQAASDRARADADDRATRAARALGHPDVAAYLRSRYLDQLQPMRVLVAELGVAKEVIRRLMDAHQVPRRGPGPTPA